MNVVSVAVIASPVPVIESVVDVALRDPVSVTASFHSGIRSDEGINRRI